MKPSMNTLSGCASTAFSASLHFFNRRVERLVAEAVLARIQCELDVLGMEHGGRNDNDRIQLRVLTISATSV